MNSSLKKNIWPLQQGLSVQNRLGVFLTTSRCDQIIYQWQRFFHQDNCPGYLPNRSSSSTERLVSRRLKKYVQSVLSFIVLAAVLPWTTLRSAESFPLYLLIAYWVNGKKIYFIVYPRSGAMYFFSSNVAISGVTTMTKNSALNNGGEKFSFNMLSQFPFPKRFMHRCRNRVRFRNRGSPRIVRKILL